MKKFILSPPLPEPEPKPEGVVEEMPERPGSKRVEYLDEACTAIAGAPEVVPTYPSRSEYDDDDKVVSGVRAVRQVLDEAELGFVVRDYGVPLDLSKLKQSGLLGKPVPGATVSRPDRGRRRFKKLRPPVYFETLKPEETVGARCGEYFNKDKRLFESGLVYTFQCGKEVVLRMEVRKSGEDDGLRVRVVQDEPLEGENEFVLYPGISFVVGRGRGASEENRFWVGDFESVSRDHLLVSCTAKGELSLCDTSTNGTFFLGQTSLRPAKENTDGEVRYFENPIGRMVKLALADGRFASIYITVDWDKSLRSQGGTVFKIQSHALKDGVENFRVGEKLCLTDDGRNVICLKRVGDNDVLEFRPGEDK